MKTKKPTHKKMLMIFLNKYFPEMAHIKITESKLYDIMDIPFYRPHFKGAECTWVEDGKDDGEMAGIRISFTTKREKPLTINQLAKLCNILCYGWIWITDMELGYGNYDTEESAQKEVDEIPNDLDTCWHHSEIRKLTDSKLNLYRITQGFCSCS